MMSKVFAQFVDEVLPALIRRGYRTGLMPGVMTLKRVLDFSAREQVTLPAVDEGAVRKALAMLAVRLAVKARTSEVDLPLEFLQREYEELGLQRFIPSINPHLLRAGLLERNDPRQGDLLLSGDPDAPTAQLLMFFMDDIAGARNAREALRIIQEYLPSLSPAFVPHPRIGRFDLKICPRENPEGFVVWEYSNDAVCIVPRKK